jgi:hypothetical protein
MELAVKPRILQIAHPSELNSLTTWRLFRKPGKGAIHLSPEFLHPNKVQWETDINRYYYACGCSSGAKGLLGMLTLGLIVGVSAFVFDALSLEQMIVFPLGSAIIGAIIGKFFGLMTAHQHLVHVIHIVQANWKPKEQIELPMVVCG